MTQHKSKVCDFYSVFKDKHKGKPVLVLGNGWSINSYPKSVYEKFYTISVNMIFGYHGFQPDIYLCSDTWLWIAFRDKLKSLKSIKISNTCLQAQDINDYAIAFSQDILEELKPIDHGHLWSIGSSVHFCIHLAAIMGASEILLHGCDGMPEHYPLHFYEEYLWDEYFNKLIQAFEFVNEPKWKSNQHNMHTDLFKKVSVTTKALGLNILNVSPISTYDCFPKANLLDFI